jgi:hypothetical protein
MPRRMRGLPLSAALASLVACAGVGPEPNRSDFADAGDAGRMADAGQDAGEAIVPDAGPALDAGDQPNDGGEDAGSDADAGSGCFLTDVGVEGQCLSTSACAALGNSTSTPGYCPGAADIQCCAPTPNVADNPPVPAGWQLMQQSAVTTAMTAWAVEILDAPTMYPMFSTATQTFGTQMVLARVEWHPPDFQNNAIHRGVTLYVPVA